MNTYLEHTVQLALPNRYTKTYIALCTKALERATTRKTAIEATQDYVEAHHILPKSFKLGGIKDKGNLVYLTLREHFIIHLLLTKMFTGQNRFHMLAAFGMMCASGRFSRFSNNREYATLRKEFYKRHRENLHRRKCTTRVGSPHTEEWKKAASERAKQQMTDPTQIAQRKIKNSQLATTPEAIERSRDAAKRQMGRSEARLAVSKANKGCIYIYNPSTCIEKRIQPDALPQYQLQGYIRGVRPNKTTRLSATLGR